MGEHNLERGQTTIMLGGKRRLIWWKNSTRRKLEELTGRGLMSLQDQNALGFDLVTNMIIAGLSYSENRDGAPNPEVVDDWIDALVTTEDAKLPEWKDAVERGEAETFATLASKLATALAWSLTGRKPDEPKADAGGAGGNEDAAE